MLSSFATGSVGHKAGYFTLDPEGLLRIGPACLWKEALLLELVGSRPLCGSSVTYLAD